MTILLFIFSLCGTGQSVYLSLNLSDAISGDAISDAHVFLVSTTFGAVSDAEGEVTFEYPDGLKEDLVISHLSYNLKIVNHTEYSSFDENHKITLNPNNLQLSEIKITASHNNKWGKQYKRFRKAFLGDNAEADQCEILNPEVLTFEEKKGEFIATAYDLLHIKNKYLGYDINYVLDHLKISKNGSQQYLGQAQYTDKIEEYKRKKIIDNRDFAYKTSSKHFFKSLLDNQLEHDKYEISIVHYVSGQFVTLSFPQRKEILVLGPSGYEVRYPEFLQIVNKNVADVEFTPVGVRPGGLESTRFGTGGRSENATVEYATSHLYKISPSILINEFGNVINTKTVREYGAWAEQKIAHQLPFDYGNDYTKTNTSRIVIKDKIFTNQNDLNSNDKLVLLISLLHHEERLIKEQTLKIIAENWEKGFVPALVEVLRFTKEQWLNDAINKMLSEKNKVKEISSFYSWLEWIWQYKIPNEDYYFKLKSEVYKHIDPKFETYFKGRKSQIDIRLDEVVWGGVEQDGIPPLRNPNMIKVNEADYLEDDNEIFGIFINGIARAYPKRILAWHEFFVDDFEEDRIAGVYCTLCGTVIAYDMTYKGVFHDLGTSGFLFRSNKLMYDKATQSLWSTIEGKPVLGPLVGQGIQLISHPVVTTTWKKWKSIHPDTEVLSLNTGHNRDYKEGAAYSSYFSSDELMFPVPISNNSLKNKDEVFVIRSDGYQKSPLAISIKYLKKKKWHQDRIAEKNIIVVADKTGATRAYEAKNITFSAFSKGKLQDDNNRFWTPQEEYLISDDGKKLYRLSGHNIFWFAWYSAYPDGRLVK